MVAGDGGKHRGLVLSLKRSQRFGERWANPPLRQRHARLRAEMSSQYQPPLNPVSLASAEQRHRPR